MDKKAKVVIYSFFALFSLISVSLFWKYSIVVTVLSALTGIIACSISRKKSDVYLFIIGGIFGVLAEVLAMHYGAWYYSNPDFFGIPLWLFFIWGNAALYLSKISKGIIEYKL